jgi:RsiW-degrading membrane proteinase PrsW (M82 family)
MFLVGFVVAIVSTLIYVTLLWWLDKYEKEPWGIFLAAFAYGCIPAVVLAVIIELVLDLGLSGNEILSAGLVAPVVEETIKGMAVLLVFFIWPREFDGVLDGIIYGAVVGLGFGMIENILYFIEGDLAVVFLRTVPFGLNHAFFTAFTGLGLGFARVSRRRWLWILLFPLSLAVAIGFHATHNLSVTTGSPAGCAIALIADWVGVIVIVVVAVLSWGHEKRWIQEQLKEEVASGLLAEDDYKALLYLSRRVGARLWMWRNHGWKAFRTLGKFFNLATELAFRKHHLQAGTARRSRPEYIKELRQQIREMRGQLLQMMGD